MKARVKATGEIINIADYARVTLDRCDSYGNPIELSFDEVEILQERSDNIDWEQRRYELAKAAMQGLTSNSFWMKNLGIHLDEHPNRNIDAIEIVSIESINYADAMIKKLKGE
jgi:hypothetical protein